MKQYKEITPENLEEIKLKLEEIRLKEFKNHEHQFWKNRNPNTCLICGKTEMELLYKQWIENLFKKYRKRLSLLVQCDERFTEEQIEKLLTELNKATSSFKSYLPTTNKKENADDKRKTVY